MHKLASKTKLLDQNIYLTYFLHGGQDGCFAFKKITGYCLCGKIVTYGTVLLDLYERHFITDKVIQDK